ncbi:hypothetical protein Pfo_018167 [Paulownia fortunei]|nr:hypothetical protein Pfo_018167 [Paulownia fortunei]
MENEANREVINDARDGENKVDKEMENDVDRESESFKDSEYDLGSEASDDVVNDAIGDASILAASEPYSTPNPASSTPAEALLRHAPFMYEQL